MSLCSLLVLLAAASTTNPFSPGIQSIPILFVLLASTLMVLTPRFHSWLHIPHCSRQVWSLTTLAWESLRLGLGRDWTPSFIFRTLSPIWILSVVGHYFAFRCYFGSLYCISCILDSFESSYIYLFCCCCGISGTVVMLPLVSNRVVYHACMIWSTQTDSILVPSGWLYRWDHGE